MRIALVAPLVTPIAEPQHGGSQAFVADLAAGLTNRGHAVDLYAAAGSEIPGVTVIDTGIDSEGLRAFLYRAGGTSVNESGLMEAAFTTVYRAIGAVRYDVIHNHAFDAPAVRLAAGLSPPVIHTLHLPPDVAVRSAIAEVMQSDRPPTVAGVSASHARAWGLATILPDGVPVEKIPWSAAPGKGVLFAGRFSSEKGGVEAIEIAQRAGVPIDLYGDAYDPEYAKAEIDPRRGLPAVTVHPSLPRAALWQVMLKAAAVLCPVQWQEPFGMVAAEAQAAGTPVIAFNRGALGEVIVDGKTGFLVPGGDVDAAAKALGHISRIERPACRRHAERQLTLERSLDAHERLYSAVSRAASVSHA